MGKHKKEKKVKKSKKNSDGEEKFKWRKNRRHSTSSSSSSSEDERRKKSRKEKSKKSRRQSTSSSSSSDGHRSRKREKKSRRRHSSTSSSSSSSSSEDRSMSLISKLEEARMRARLEEKKRKRNLKANETVEEKRLRRLDAKKRKNEKRKLTMEEYQQYTNEENPFGDTTLTSAFVWKKKIEQDGHDPTDKEQLEVLNRKKMQETRIELEKVKKRRLERELEQQQREEEMVAMQRNKEAAQFEEWEKQEDQFHLEQALLRSKIRIEDGRAKPIDLLAQYINQSNLEDSLEMQMHEPYTYLNGLEMEDLEDLLVDINVYKDLEGQGGNSNFWEDMTIIVNDELQKMKKQETTEMMRREGIHQSVAKDVSEIFRKKTTKQLDKMKREIQAKLKSKAEGVDINYWESLLSQLEAFNAKSRLMDKHQENLRSKLQLLKTEAKEETVSTQSSDHEEPKEPEVNIFDPVVLYENGSYSPIYIKKDDLEEEIINEIISLTSYEKMISDLRWRTIRKEKAQPITHKEDTQMIKEARKGMGEDEAQFSVETKLDSQVYLWSDKYRPRKPRYFNRVHTGFEWNKYNQTHYDMDNPPPKIVQGYKFNIFYPDLIDKGSTPQYFLTSCKDNPDFAILRFHAGPPYEDIAFKIVNREWEYSYKRGFRCQFHNNIFQLWFHFKRYRYRR
ncbi:CACTIN family protein [Megaselia abdita]